MFSQEIWKYVGQTPSIHLFSIPASSVGWVTGGAGTYPSGHQVRGGVHPGPWTGHQSITGPHRDKRDKQPHTCSHSLLRTILETPINLTCIFWMVGGSWSTRREPTHTRGEHANSTHKGPSRELNLELSVGQTQKVIFDIDAQRWPTIK